LNFMTEMNEKLWEFVDATGELWSASYGLPRMTGRVLAFLLVCDPPEQTAAQIGEALDASKGSISAATGMLVRARLADRLHIRGERADRFRLRPDMTAEQIRDPGIAQARALIAQGLEALSDEPQTRRARLEEMDVFYAWWQSRMDSLADEWEQYKREHHG
jgi:DNA-binding transcriptional regulator GbsR (MarR family)